MDILINESILFLYNIYDGILSKEFGSNPNKLMQIIKKIIPTARPTFLPVDNPDESVVPVAPVKLTGLSNILENAFDIDANAPEDDPEDDPEDEPEDEPEDAPEDVIDTPVELQQV